METLLISLTLSTVLDTLYSLSISRAYLKSKDISYSKLTYYKETMTKLLWSKYILLSGILLLLSGIFIVSSSTISFQALQFTQGQSNTILVVLLITNACLAALDYIQLHDIKDKLDVKFNNIELTSKIVAEVKYIGSSNWYANMYREHVQDENEATYSIIVYAGARNKQSESFRYLTKGVENAVKYLSDLNSSYVTLFEEVKIITNRTGLTI
jgi:hypothetical protein